MSIFARNRAIDDRRGPMTRFAYAPTWLRWALLAFAVIFTAFLCWLGFQVWNVKSQLEQARSYAQQTKDALLGGRNDEATRWAENAQFNARQAQAAAHSLPFNMFASVPVIGSPLKTTQQISDVVVGLASDVLLPATKVGAGISPDKLVEGARINLDLLRQQQPQLSELAEAARKLDTQSQTIARPAYLSLIGNARSQLQDQTAKLSSLLTGSAIAAQLAPSMLGAEGPRTYLIGFQTPAEARGTGGLLGGFGILRFDNGLPTVDSLGSNTELSGGCTEYRGYNCVATIPGATVDLGPEFEKVYGWTNPLGDFRNSNLSPHFPYAAQIWKSMREVLSGKTVDGVIALDPVALSYLLRATGPVTLGDGEVINADNVVELTMSTAYVRFSSDNAARKKYLLDIANAVVEKMTGSIESPREILDALGKAAAEGRISVWSAFPADQKLLEETPLAHIVPDDVAPYAQVVINNLAGNKMDYYLKREIEYAADDCDGAMRNSTITVRLSNTAPPDNALPDNVAGLVGLQPNVPIKAPRGTMVSSVRVLATKGARLLSVTSDDKRTVAVPNVENGRPSFEVQVAIPPSQSGELTFRLSEPTSPGEPRVPVQPLTDTVTPKVAVPTCSG